MRSKGYIAGVDVGTIHMWVCKSLGKNAVEMKNRDDRRVDAAKARHLTWAISDEITSVPHTKIAGYYNRDHSSVNAGIRAIQGYLFTHDQEVITAINYVADKVQYKELLNKIKERKFNDN